MDETKYDFGEEEVAGCCTAAVGETFGLSDDEMLLFGERCVSGETELLDESAVIADCTDDGAVAGATAGGDAPVLPGRRNSGRRADRPHRRRRKLMTIAAIFALIAIAFSVWFFACNSVEGGVESKQPSDSVSYCLTPPSDGSLPEDHTALDNLGYVIGRLTGRSCYHTESSSVVTAKAMGVTVNQYVEGGKDYKDGVLKSTTFSRGEGLGAPAPVAVQRFFGKDRAVLRNSVSSDPSTWAGADTEWADGEPSEVIAREEYADRYGLWGTEFSDYVMTEETILSFSELERDGEMYELSFSLDPATATYYYGKQMVTMGGLSESPQFMYADVTLRFTSDWSVTEMTVNERYVSVKGVINADTSGETVIKYSYDEADADVSAYETYFSKYADAEPTGDAEKDRSAADYLTEGFGSVLVSDRTAFDVGAVINGKSVTGRALLAMDGGSPSSVTLELGELTALADISDGRIYVSYKDFLGSLALSDVSELLGGALPVGDISIDLESALADAAVTRGEGCAEVTMTLAIGDLALPLRFEFSETDADVAWTGIYADLDLGGIAVSLTVTPGDASVPFEEIDRGAATDIMPAVRAILALAQGPVRADISYAGDGFTLDGDVVFGSDSDVMSGSITVSADGISPVDVAFAYSDGDVYLSVGGIKVRAAAGDWVSALLGLAGSELPAVSDIDLGRVADALLGMDFDSVIENVTLDAGGLALTLDCDAIISSLLPDSGISMGKLTASFDPANSVFTASVLGIEITLGGTDAMPSLPEGMENYVLLTPEQALGFADAVKAVAGSDDIAFGMSGTVTINGISVDAEIAGEVWTDTNAVVLVVTVSGESVRLVYDGGITVIYGDHGLRMSEEELNDMLASLSSLFGDASATSVLAELDIASLLADIKLFTANGDALGIAADLSSLLADTSMNVEVSYSSDGVSLSGTVTIAGVKVESASAYVRTADDELSSSVDGVTMCGNAVEFALEAYMRLTGSEYISFEVAHRAEGLTADVKGEIKLVRTESAIAFELAADAAVRSGDDTYYIQVRLVDDTLYVYFSLVGFEDSAYFPDCVDASARPLRLRFTVGSVAAAARDLMPLISSLMAEEWDGSGLLGMAAELLGRVDGALTTDIADIKTTGEWVEFILSLVGSDGAKSSADGGRMNVTVDTSLRRLTLKDEATSVVIGTGIMRSVTAPEAEHIDLSSVAELAGTLMSSITSSAEDGEGTESVRINDYYYLSGSASGSLGSLELTSIGIAASVYVHPDYSVTVNVRLTVSYFIGVFNGDTVLDMTVEDGMVYMVRTQTSEAGFLGIEKQLDEPEVILRAMTLDSFLSGMLEQIPFMFNFSDSISEQITGSGSGSGSDPAAVTDIGDVLLSVAYSASKDGSQAWTLGIGLGALTGGVLGDASVQLRAGADGVLEDIALSASLSVLTMNAELKYVNPGAEQESGHAVDVTENVAGRVSRLLAKAIARGDGFAEGRAAVITYSADGNAIGSEEMAYSAEGEVLTELEMPDLTGYGNGGYTYSWGELASVSGDVTLEAEKAANSYPVVLVSEYEIDGLDGEVRDGAYVYELTYTYGTTLALPAGAVSGMAYSLSYFTDGSERFTEVSGITSPLTLTAVWEEIEYTVTYTVLGEVYDVITYGYGDELILPECAPAGYTFVRWDADTDIVTSDMTVEAVLSVTVDVISGTAADGMERRGDAYASSVRVEGKTTGDFATLPEFTADGYESFGLWVKGDDGWRPATDLAGMDGAELYAAWASDISVTITEAGKSFWSTWTVRGTFSGGTFDDDISREIASDAGVTTSARAQLCLYKVDGSGNITDTDKLSEVSADGGSFGKSGMTSFFGVTGTWHGGAEVTVTLSCEGMSLTLESRAWQ